MQRTLVDADRRRVMVPSGGRGGDTVEVAYRVAGAGDPVVCLHGVGLDAGDVSYRYLLPELARDRRVYVPDFPGHGDSEKPRTRYTTDYFGGILDGFLNELGLDDAALVGTSMGGAVALGHALEYGTDELVLADSYGLGGDAPWRAAAWGLLRVPLAHRAWWRQVGASHAAVRSHLATMCARVPDDLVADVYAAIQEAAVGRTVASWQRSEFRACGLATDYTDRLDDLDAEPLFVHGVADPLLPARWSQRAAEATDGEYVPFEGSGHWPAREQPERFTRTVRRFLN